MKSVEKLMEKYGRVHPIFDHFELFTPNKERAKEFLLSVPESKILVERDCVFTEEDVIIGNPVKISIYHIEVAGHDIEVIEPADSPNSYIQSVIGAHGECFHHLRLTFKEHREHLAMCRAHSLGYDSMPRHFYPCAAMPVKKLLCDVNAAEEGAERYGWEESTCDWQEVVAREDIDLVDIVVPNDLHHVMCLEAAKHGKMIYCEKPLGLNFEDSLEIYRAIRKAGVKHAVAFNKRRWPAAMFAKKLISEGRIGEIINFRCEMQQSFALNRSLPLTWKFQKKRPSAGQSWISVPTPSTWHVIWSGI